ncbi:MAG: bactofilin family protein [Acidiferrobacteraceae bacterium]
MRRQRAVDQLSELPEVVEASSVQAKDLCGRRNLIVHGEVLGDGQVEGSVFLGPTSRWAGNLSADLVVIKGRFEGNVKARHKIEVRGTASIHGNLEAPVIAVAKGALIDGDYAPNSCVIYFEERRG